MRELTRIGVTLLPLDAIISVRRYHHGEVKSHWVSIHYVDKFGEAGDATMYGEEADDWWYKFLEHSGIEGDDELEGVVL